MLLVVPTWLTMLEKGYRTKFLRATDLSFNVSVLNYSTSKQKWKIFKTTRVCTLINMFIFRIMHLSRCCFLTKLTNKKKWIEHWNKWTATASNHGRPVVSINFFFLQVFYCTCAVRTTAVVSRLAFVFQRRNKKDYSRMLLHDNIDLYHFWIYYCI